MLLHSGLITCNMDSRMDSLEQKVRLLENRMQDMQNNLNEKFDHLMTFVQENKKHGESSSQVPKDIGKASTTMYADEGGAVNQVQRVRATLSSN